MLKTVYRLTFRAVQGLLNSILEVLGVDLSSPDYTLFCKRAKTTARPFAIAINSSGLKIIGEGEWKVKNMNLYLSLDYFYGARSRGQEP